jgi:glucose/arabinose dehydrogenase
MSIPSRLPLVVLSFLVAVATATSAVAGRQGPAVPDGLTVPAGFRLSVYADGVENARQMALGSGGTVFVGSRTAGKVYAVVDRDGDRRADEVKTIASGLTQPNGVAFRNGSLFIATETQILRLDDIERRLESTGTPVLVHDNLPRQTNSHTWKYIGFGPDDRLYVPVGAPCNICESGPEFATILRMFADG